LGDSTRRRIFELVAARARSVAEVAREVPVSRPAVSQHLKVLKDATLVRARAEGTRRIYELDREGLLVVRTYIDTLWDAARDRFKAAAEAKAAEVSRHKEKTKHKGQSKWRTPRPKPPVPKSRRSRRASR